MRSGVFLRPPQAEQHSVPGCNLAVWQSRTEVAGKGDVDEKKPGACASASAFRNHAPEPVCAQVFTSSGEVYPAAAVHPVAFSQGSKKRQSLADEVSKACFKRCKAM